MVRQRTVIDKDAIGKFLEEGRGKGTGAHYNPWLTVRGVVSQEAVKVVKRWKTGKIRPLLSNLEREALFVFEWSAN